MASCLWACRPHGRTNENDSWSGCHDRLEESGRSQRYMSEAAFTGGLFSLSWIWPDRTATCCEDRCFRRSESPCGGGSRLMRLRGTHSLSQEVRIPESIRSSEDWPHRHKVCTVVGSTKIGNRHESTPPQSVWTTRTVQRGGSSNLQSALQATVADRRRSPTRLSKLDTRGWLPFAIPLQQRGGGGNPAVENCDVQCDAYGCAEPAKSSRLAEDNS